LAGVVDPADCLKVGNDFGCQYEFMQINLQRQELQIESQFWGLPFGINMYYAQLSCVFLKQIKSCGFRDRC